MNTKTLVTCLHLGFLLLPAAARAQEASPSPAPEVSAPAVSDGKLPIAVIDRPLTLPRGVVAPALRLDIFNIGGASSGTGESLAAGVDVGVTNRLQLGLVVAIPINPNANFGTIFATAAVQLHKAVGLRLDIGYDRAVTAGPRASNGVTLGLGVPIKLRLHRLLSFVSGSTTGLDYAIFENEAAGSYNAYNVLPVTGSDLISYGHIDTGGNTSLDELVINVPVGLLIQPHQRVALTLKAGYSFAYSHISDPAVANSSFKVHYVPVGLDLLVTVVRQLDLGASFALLGIVHADGQSGDVYADTRIITVRAQGHF